MSTGSARALAWLAAAAVASIAAVELAHHVALSTAEARHGRCVVLVLGSPTRADGSPSAVQRFRADAGVAALRENRCERIVLSGGAVANRFVEAQALAKLVRAHGVPDGQIVVEGRARSTWENVGCSLPNLADAERILIVSNGLHAWRGRRYLCRQAPSLCARTEIATRPLPTWRFGWKALVAAYELAAWTRDLLLGAGGATASDGPACPVASGPPPAAPPPSAP